MANFDGRPGALPITAYYKGNFALQFAFTSGGSAYSLAGASATFVIYEKNGTAALSLSSGSGLTISGAAGTIDLAITNAQIVALATQEYNYELIITLSGGTVWPVLDSVFNVSENGQASYSGDTVTVALDGNSISLSVVPAAVADGRLLPDGGTTGQVLAKTSNSDYAADWTTVAGTGDALTSNSLAQFAATTSAELRGVLSDETGTGAAVFANTPTLVTPVLGAATATSVNKVAVTAPATGATLTIADGATLSAPANATVSGTNTGDQNLFSTIAVSGQSNVVADSTGDTLTLVAGSNVTITTDASTDSITINATGGGGGGGDVSDGDTLTTGLTFPNTGLHILDTNASHDLIISPGSDLTADHTLTITTGDADRTLTISGNTTLGGGSHSGTNTGDQTIQLTGDVTGSGTGSFAATIANNAVTFAKMQAVSANVLLGNDATGTAVEEITCTPFARTVLDDTDAATARTTLGVDAAGTDNSTPVTLAGSLDYITLSGQQITRNAIDLATDTTGLLDAANIGAGSVSNTEFGYLDGVTSAIQTQFGAKAASGANTDITSVFLNNTGLKVKDTNASHGLSIVPGSDLTADHTLTLTTGDADRTLTLSGNATLSGGTHSGTNTGDQSLFSTIAVSGQSDVVADTTGDTLTLVAGSNITITTNATTDSITIASNSVSTDAIWDAKGDLAVGTGANTAQKLTVGTNGHLLYADSSQTTGLRWGPSVISPSQITSDQDNYSPTGWAGAQIVRLSGDNGIRAITSMAAGFSGEIKEIINVGSYPVYFPGEHPDGTAANRISIKQDYMLHPGISARVFYDGTSSRWRFLGRVDDETTGRVSYYRQSAASQTVGDWGEIAFTAIGTGSAVGGAAANTTYPAYNSLSSVSSSTGGATLHFIKTNNQFAYLGNSHIFAEFLTAVQTLSDGTETFETGWQITADPASTSVVANNTVGIRYTHSTNSGKFQGYSRDNAGSESTVDLGVTVTGTQMYVLRIEIDKARAEARFYIDGTMSGRVTGNMPTANPVGARAILLKSAGTTARQCRVITMAAGAIHP